MFDGKQLKAARKAKGLTQRQLGERLGVSEQAVSQWEQGKNGPEFARILRISEELEQPMEVFSGSSNLRKATSTSRKWRVPRVNSVAAGDWSEIVKRMNEDEFDWLEIGFKPVGDGFALELEGQSMSPDFNAGDDVIVDTGKAPYPGAYVIAKLDHEDKATFKRYRLKGYDDDGREIIELVPINPDYPVLELSQRRPGRIIAVLVEHRRHFR